MKIYDISMTINEDMMVYKDSEAKKPKITNTANYETHSHYESKIFMDMHTGTHIDAPLHMVKDGAVMDCYNIEDYVSDAKVIDFTNIDGCIKKEDLVDKGIVEGDFLLLKTKNSYDEGNFNYDFVYLETSGAEYLADIGIKGVGTDALGIERAQADHSTHITLLSKRIMIVEGLRLKDVPEGEYQFIILPIKILETEAAPARAILIEK